MTEVIYGRAMTLSGNLTNDEGETIVLRFFNAPNGELQCRAREAKTERSWLIAEPARLRVLVRIEVVSLREPSSERANGV